MGENQLGIKYIKNHYQYKETLPKFITLDETKKAKSFHETLDNYEKTPLISLRQLAEDVHISGFLVKDESKRFGLNAFKGLGGVYSMAKIVCNKVGVDLSNVCFSDLKSPEIYEKLKGITFVTATDGNHGKGVAWAANELGCKSQVYMPKGSSTVRAQAIRDVGNSYVEITELSYDDAVRYASSLCTDENKILVQDTSFEAYEEIPKWIMQGYATIVHEILEQIKEMNEIEPTHIFLQAGVGAMAGSLTGSFADIYKQKTPIITIVEPYNVACIYKSAEANDGTEHYVEGINETIMAGLNCGEPCSAAWPILRDYAHFYLKCPDFIAAHGMRLLANPKDNDLRIVSGESGAVTAGIAHLIASDSRLNELKDELMIDSNSVILVINTEGDTDPEHYKEIVNEGIYPCI